MDTIKIETGIPIPLRNQQTSPLATAFRKMKVGDSFLYPRKNAGSVHTSARNVGVKVAVRKETEDTIRIWRIK